MTATARNFSFNGGPRRGQRQRDDDPGRAVVRFIEDVNAAILDQEILTAETRYTASQDEAEKTRLHDALVQLRELKKRVRAAQGGHVFLVAALRDVRARERPFFMGSR